MVSSNYKHIFFRPNHLVFRRDNQKALEIHSLSDFTALYLLFSNTSVREK
uniref:Uncharacterized protein n=1 Tax=Sphingobacterium sp. (strain 21) TaxID=743722 RepID=F4C9X1_SPHS2